MKNVFCLLLISFIAYVRMPMQKEMRYEVKRVQAFGELGEAYPFYLLTLMDGRTVYVPVLFTIIEEK